MTWMIEHKTVWRIALGAAALAAFLGPWFFDRIFVPSDYTCSPPFVRLDDRFCGLPIAGVRFVGWTLGLFASAGELLTADTSTFGESAREFFLGLLLLMPLLPFFSTALLVLRGERQRRQVFNAVAWTLAAGVALLVGSSNHPEKFWALWGVWLYFGLAIGTLALEALTAKTRRNRQES